MNCNEARQNLEPALDGALDEAAQRLLREHVSTCALCKERLAQLEAVRALLREAAPTSPSESLDARVMGSFRKHHAARSDGRAAAIRLRDLFFGSLRVPVPIMGMLLVAVVAIVLLAYRTGKQNAQQIVVNAAPAASEHLQTSDSPGEVDKTVPVDKTIPVPATAKLVQASASRYRSNRLPARVKSEVTEQPLQSSTVITSNSTNYSTVAVLKGFEPLPIATARIIKGEQR
ncbi:MAG: zf-HC2 domain-containing protein [Pyrinomonadaceae bacterium]|nr:zf-HC2 domain-containing protein [Pyrinomonadaceae bacterium]